MISQIETIARNIKTLRNSLNLSQTDFAERIGVSRDVINNLEHGRLQSVETKMPLFRLIAKEFGVDLEWLLHGDGDPELPDLTEAEAEAKRMGELIASEDPTVRAFLEFWSQRTRAEREMLSRQIIEFADALKRNME